MKDSEWFFFRCVPSHASGDRYQVECGLGSQHVVDLVEDSCSCKNWDLTGIPCMHAVFDIYSNFIRLVRGPKQWEFVPDMLPILPPMLRRLLDRLTKVRRKEFDEPQTTESLTKRGVKRQKFGIHNQMVAPTQQEATPTHQQAALTHRQADSPREKLPFKRKPTTVRWIPFTQESSVSDPSMT
ncbi:hypothetical protein Gotur_015899, partial [Gossypium turneri]